ncbi:hypothetical protein ACO1O0_003403 [Amphichorda felina]
MADKQPPTVVEGATTGDVEDEIPSAAAKSAEDRKAASALASLDAGNDSSSSAAKANIDQDAVNKAMKNLPGASATKQAPAPARKNVKVDAADVALLVDQLDMTKPKATELLKAHDGDAVRAMRAYVSA